jgi:hypothetical protein
MLTRGSDDIASAGLPSDQEVRDILNDLKARYLSHLTTNQTGDEGHYNMILESLNTAILESEQSVDRQKVGAFLSEWDATVAWLEGEQELGSTMTRPLSAISVALGTAVGLSRRRIFLVDLFISGHIPVFCRCLHCSIRIIIAG